MPKVIVAIILVAVVGIAAYFFTSPQASIPAEEATQETVETVEEVTEEIEQTIDENAVVFDITGKNLEFSMDTIQVKKGDTVTINFTSEEGFHNWAIDEFDAATERVNTGETSSVTFVADTVGEFEYYCAVNQHRQLGMVGTLVVTE